MIAGIFAFFISKDAKKFMRGENSLSKINNTIIYILHYINENMLDSGEFIQANSLRSKIPVKSNSYDISCHAQMLHTLYLCENLLELKGLDKRCEKSLKYLLDNYLTKIDNKKYAILCEINNDETNSAKAKISATANTILALCDLNVYKYVDAEQLEGLGNFLLFMQKRNGQFYTAFDTENFELEDDKINLNYTGDAVLALLALYKFNHKEKWLNGAKKGLIFLANIRKNLEKTRFDDSSMTATNVLLNLDNPNLTLDEELLLKSHITKMAEQAMSNQVISKNDEYFGALVDNIKTKDIACMVEGLIATFNCIDDELLKMRIMRSIDMAMKFLRVLQIQKGRFKGAFPNAADWREFRASNGSGFVSMDTMQHVLSACVKFQKMFIEG